MANFKRKFAERYEIQNSDDTEVWVAQEASPGTLPAAASQYWREVEANSFSDFGTQLTTAARTYFNPARVEGKPRVIREEAMCGWQADITDDQFPRFAVGFLFHDEREIGQSKATHPKVKGAKPDTHSIFRDAPVLVGTGGIATAAIPLANTPAALGSRAFAENDLIKILDRDNGPNNNKVVKLLTTTSATSLAVPAASFTAQDQAASASVRVVCVGHEFASGDIKIVIDGSGPNRRVTLVATAGDFNALDLSVGETIVVGGQADANRFAASGTNQNNGFATIESIAEKTLVFSDTAFDAVNAPGTGKSIQLFFGDHISNGNTRRTYTVARTLGEGLDSSNVEQKQGEYVKGALPNECTINLQPDSFLNTDFAFMPLIAEEFDYNTTAPQNVANAHRVRRRGLEGYSAQSDIYRAKLAVKNDSTDLFSWIESATITLSNNVTGTTALGVPGYISQDSRKFTATGTLDVLFERVASTTQIRKNTTCFFDVITVAVDSRHGIVYNIPNLTLAGNITVEQGENIKQNLELTAFGDANGLAASITTFQHVPEFVDSI